MRDTSQQLGPEMLFIGPTLADRRPLAGVSGPKQFINTTCVILYPEVGPGLRHLQLPVVLSVGEALKAEHLPGVIEAGFVSWDGSWARGQVLRPAVLLGQRQVPVGGAGVKGQRASVCKETERNPTD